MTRFFVGRTQRLRLGALALIAAIVLPAVWYLGSPLVINHTVEEAAPPGVVFATNQAIVTRSGQFGVIDVIHKGTGRAFLGTLPDGRHILRFERFRVTNGPTLYVYLSGHRAPRTPQQLHAGGAYEVAPLKGNIGNQNYLVPARVDIARFKSAVIYCKQFHVIFSTATLT